MDELRVLTPTGMLGYGLPEQWLKKGLERQPHVITADAGSTDSGPHKLGMGALTCSREAYVEDIGLLLEAGQAHQIPVYMSSAGGAGSNLHVDIFVDIVQQLCKDKGHHFKIAVIRSEIEKDVVSEKLRHGRIAPCGPVEPLTQSEIDDATTIVAQMGVEPFLDAIDMGADVIIAGRAYDPVPIAALGIKHGFDPGLCWHMGKIMECGALCGVPSGKSILGYLRQDHFMLEPLDEGVRCTESSVAAHTLYEKSHPYLLPGPGGTLDLSHCRFEQEDEYRVNVYQSQFVPAPQYTVKLEGSKLVGYRSTFIGGIRDPLAIERIDEILAGVKQQVDDYFMPRVTEGYELIFHVYGKNGVMGEQEVQTRITSHELCVVVEVAAHDQDVATAICSRARTAMLHFPYPGRIATAGNVASPFTPLEIPLGPVYQFNVYHLMEVDDPCAHFPIEWIET